jgi:hypothetical protein
MWNNGRARAAYILNTAFLFEHTLLYRLIHFCRATKALLYFTYARESSVDGICSFLTVISFNSYFGEIIYLKQLASLNGSICADIKNFLFFSFKNDST